MNKALKLAAVPVIATFLFGAFVALPAAAQSSPIEQCTLVRTVTVSGTTYTATTVINSTNPDWGTICLINTINVVVDWVFIFLIAVAVVLIVIAGFMYLTSGGSSDRQATAANMIKGAVVGIVIALLARVIPAVVTGILL